MAQIIYYWKYPRSVSFGSSDRYTTETEKITIDDDHEKNKFPSFEELNSLLSNIQYDGDMDEIAALSFACGISVRMDYKEKWWFLGSEGSAYIEAAASAYKNKFNYASAELKYNDAADFYSVLSDNMKNAQPAQLAIYKKQGEEFKGHSIVADGFKETGEYHLNFGWGGSSDGWYFLPAGMPSGYNVISAGIVNIYPPARFAVTDPYWDDIGKILTAMGYKFDEIQDSQLANYDFIKKYDAIFINCSGDSAANAPAARDSLRQYVQNGGALYASDYAFVYFKESFPGYLIFPDNPYIGIGNQHVTATITDPGLKLYLLQDQVDIFYNLGAWVILDDVGPDTQVIMRGDVQVWTGSALSMESGPPSHHLPSPISAQGIQTLLNKPLAASFRYGDGFAIYTTFHNEPQLTGLQRKLLEYFIIKPIIAKIAKWLGDLIKKLGYTIEQEIPNIINQAQTKIFPYIIDKIKNVIITLGFGGSRFRVSVYRPDGSLYTELESESSPIVIEIPNVEPGEWTFGVTAVDVPYDNYPFVIVVGTEEVRRELFFDDLEPLPEPGWQTTSLWHLAENTSCAIPGYSSPTHAFYYGDEGTCRYSGSGMLTSPQIALPEGTKRVILSFDYFLQKGLSDIPSVQVSFNRGRSWSNVRWYSRSPTQGRWVSTGEIHLLVPRGATSVMVRFSFTTRRGSTGGIGWLIDNISLAVPPPLRIIDEALPTATLGQPYRHTMTARGGTPPYTWIARGLPAGLRMNSRTGVISGTPRRAGSYNVTITVRDQDSNSVSQNYTLTVLPAGALGFEPLQVYSLTAAPMPARETVKFIAVGTGIKEIGVEVFNLAGARVFNSSWVQNGFSWGLKNDRGQPVANGVYLYIITVRGFDGTILRSEAKKLVILR